MPIIANMKKQKKFTKHCNAFQNLQIKQNMELKCMGSDEEYFGIKIKDQTAYLMSFRHFKWSNKR